MKRIMDIIKNPAEAIRAAKKEKDMKKTTLIMIEAWIFAAIAVFIITARFGTVGALGGGAGATAVFLSGIIITIVMGYLLKVSMTTLGGRGGFYEGLTTITYVAVPFTVGILIASILSYVPVLGVMISFIIAAILGVMGTALLYRGTKEMFSTDMVTTLVGISVLILGLFLAFYISIITGAVGLAGLTQGALTSVV